LTILKFFLGRFRFLFRIGLLLITNKYVFFEKSAFFINCAFFFADFSTNKQVTRALPRRREQPNFSKQDTGRPSNNNNKPKNKNNVDKYQLPRSRGNFHSTLASNGSAGLTEPSMAAFESEVNSIYSPGSKKQSLNHLLNFHYAPREHGDAPNYVKAGNHNSGYRSKPRYNKEQFLQANCQFVVRDGYGFDYSAFLSTADALVDWNQIEQVNVRSAETPQCPICLYEPVAAKMTRCGHVYCWPCILHYLALSDKAWRKCPICFTSVYSADLKSAVAKPQTVYKVGDRITLCLMRKEKDSLQVEKVTGKEQKRGREAVAGIPHLFDDAEKRMHSKLVLASRDEILHILEREKMELRGQLDFDGHDCPESVFVEEALQAVLLRIQQLFGGQDAPAPISAPQPEIAEAVEAEELDEATGGEESVLAPDQAIDEDTDLTINDIDIVAAGANTKYHYFYQAEDGQNLFLHSLNSRLLQAAYGALEQSPLTVTGKIVQKDCCSLSDDLRKRLRYLQHLPVSSSFEIVEIELDRGLIGQEVLDRFHGELAQRRKMRQRKNREENIRERHISELNDRQMGLSMAKSANIEIRSSQQFPSVSWKFLIHFWKFFIDRLILFFLLVEHL
jgi:Zinc finger, C3HC4 type (RING finger)